MRSKEGERTKPVFATPDTLDSLRQPSLRLLENPGKHFAIKISGITASNVTYCKIQTVTNIPHGS